MSRSFGPVVVVDAKTSKATRVHCNWCIFRSFRSGEHACTYKSRAVPMVINTPDETPDWCEMKAGNIRDSEDMASGIEHHVIRWSGRKSDTPREIYAGIPSEASRQFRLAARDLKRGTVCIEDDSGKTLAIFPEKGGEA